MLLTRLLICIALTIAVTSVTLAQTTIVRGPTLNSANGNIYLAVQNTSSTNYEAMRTFARSLGGDLATINDAAENEWIRAVFASPLAAKVWIGLNDSAVEGTFAWSNGEVSAYRNWQSSEPSNSASSDYVQLFDSDGRWACRPNGATQYAVIELPRIIRVPQLVPTLQAALDLAIASSRLQTEIILEPGTYRGGFSIRHFQSVKIRGTGDPALTILDGGGVDRPLTTESDSAVRLEGLTIARGRALGRGGAAYLGGRFAATNCVFRDNEVSLDLLNAGGEGGAVFADRVDARFDRCVFERNRSAKSGSVIFASESQVMCTRLIIRANVTGTNARFDEPLGVVSAVQSNVTMSNCAIVGNRPAHPDAASSVFHLNNPSDHYNYGASLRLSSCTIAGNDTNGTYFFRDVPGIVNASNCILMHDGGYLCTPWNSVLENCISNTTQDWWPLIASDPLFVDLDGSDNMLGTSDDDFCVAAGSPAIDAGDASLYLGSTKDLLGHPRFSGVSTNPADDSPIDIGAVEFEQARCPADMDDGSGTGTPDGGVTIEDLLFFLARFQAGC